ncbi:RNA-directed DNA polymerase, eukaryota [Tanacetum coccineum]
MFLDYHKGNECEPFALPLEASGGLNDMGIGRKVKNQWVWNLCSSHNLGFISIQETKKENKDIIEENFIAIEGKWIPFSTPILIISVYAPQDFNEKKLLWSRLTSLMSDWHGETIITGDFNEVRWAHESNDGVSDANAIIRIKNKLKVLKNILKEWSKTKREDRSKQKRDCLTNLEEIDRHIDQGLGDQSDLDSRLDFTNQLLDLEKKESIDLYQKAKIKWAIEGDENSKFVAPDWTRPIKLKEFPRFLSKDQANSLELPIMHDEVKKAVWDCGSNKVPGPDSFTFEFFKKFWYLIESDVFNAVAHFFQSGQFPTGCNLFFITLILKVVDAKLVNDFRPISPIGCIYKIIGKILANRFLFVIGDLVSIEQSAFIKGRQILDGPFILNEMISWCKRHKHKAMMLKIDFQKAYDSVRWDFLDYILTRFKFRSKWRAWIQGCFSSCIGSILVNGAPTREFKFQRGLRQGDPLVPFLFLLVMESLHISFSRIIDRGLFSPINIGHDNPVTLSHLFYADDAIFISKWSTLNVVAITGLLRYFHMASRLKVNFHKSSLIGVSVNPNDVGSMANVVGCKASKLPFTYLSVNVGDNMTRAKAWSGVCSKLLLNDPHALWVRVVKVIYGEDGLLFSLNSRCRYNSVWTHVLKVAHDLKHKGLDLLALCIRKVGNGLNIEFWNDTWHGDQPHKVRFSRVFALESSKNVFVAQMMDQGLSTSSFRRPPKGGIEESQWEDLKRTLDYIRLSNTEDRWFWSLRLDGVRMVNCYGLELLMESLATRENLFSRDIAVPSLL